MKRKSLDLRSGLVAILVLMALFLGGSGSGTHFHPHVSADAPAAPPQETPEVTPVIPPETELLESTPDGPVGTGSQNFQGFPPPPEKVELPDSPLGAAGLKSGLPKLSSTLNRLRDGASLSAADGQGRLALELDDNRVKVMLIMLDEASAEAAVAALPGLGGEVTAHFQTWIDAWVPVEALEVVAALPGVGQVREITLPLPVGGVPEEANGAIEAQAGTGAFVTRGLTESNVINWHNHVPSFQGTGVNVAVLDYFKDYQLAQAQGELPPSSRLLTDPSLIESSRHGTAVAEIIYDMAPQATILLTSPATATEMAIDIITWAASGYKIIASAIVFYNLEPGDGTGPLSEAIGTAKNSFSSLFVQAAGDKANRNWQGYYNNPDEASGDRFHKWDGQILNQLGFLNAGERVNIYLRWNDWPVSDQDYDLFLYRFDSGDQQWKLYEQSTNSQTGSQPPTEGIEVTIGSAGFYGIAIWNGKASGGHVLDLMGNYPLVFQYKIRDRSLIDPATSLSSFGVAAIDIDTFAQESYSSEGPSLGPGGFLSGGNRQPRIAGFANVDTWSYAEFDGTSAAAAHVAGAAAVLWSAYPGYTVDQIRQILVFKAIDQGPPLYDYQFGFGRLYLPDYPIELNLTPRMYLPTIGE